MTRAAVVSFIVVTSLSFASCGKSLEDYRKDKFAERVAELQKISGTYEEGELASRRDELSIGLIGVDLYPDSTVQNSSDNLSSEQRATMSGRITYRGITTSTVNLKDGYYDEDTGRFQAVASIANAAGGTTLLTLKGTIRDNVFNGQLYAADEAYGASFSLTRVSTASDGSSLVSRPIPGDISSHLKSGRARELSSENQVFIGHRSFEDQTRTVTMTFSYPEVDNDQRFLQIFQPKRSLKITLDLALGSQPPIQFETATIDDRAPQQLQARAAAWGANRSPCILVCARDAAAGVVRGWTCSLTIGNHSQPTLVLQAQAAPESK